MPNPHFPDPTPPIVLVGYQAMFSADIGTAGFDILDPAAGGYASTVEGNRTIRPIPWAILYSVVIQRGGLLPHVRHYHGFVYIEADFLALALLVNRPLGSLVTPREPTPIAANLDSITRGNLLDPNNPLGATAIDLNFTLLA